MINILSDEFKSWMESVESSIISDLRNGLPSVTKKDISDYDDDAFYKVMYVSVWDAFKTLYNNRQSSLEDKTKYYRRVYNEVIISSFEDYLKEDVDKLQFIIRLMMEYIFWSGDVDRAVPGFLHERECFERLDNILNVRNGVQLDVFVKIYDDSPIKIMREFILSKDLKDAKAFSREIVNENYRIEALQEKTKRQIEKISDIQGKLTEYVGEYNFVLLSKAFVRMKGDKEKECRVARGWMNLYTAALIFIPIFILFSFYEKWLIIDATVKHLMYAVPLLTLEILIFYFMRLYYSEVRSIKAQLLQIDLRLSLCEFVHDFINNKNESKGNADSWRNFESLIFSPIQMTADNIPSVLDGANAVADVLGKVMPKKGS